MRILMITRLYSPHIGGVERHVQHLTDELLRRKSSVTIITEKYTDKTYEKTTKEHLNIIRFNYPKIKFIGIFFIWLNLAKNIKHFLEADLIHIHDVFIWYLPFRVLLFFKPVFTTFHGWEGNYPIPKISIVQKKIANYLSKGTISVGDYIGNFFQIKPTLVIYGGVNQVKNSSRFKDKILYLGRLDKDTGILDFLNFLDKNSPIKEKIIFVGDGKYKEECLKYGRVTGFINPKRLLNKARIVVTSGYLSILECFNSKVKVYVCPDNNLKKDYYKLSPFSKLLNYLTSQTSKKQFYEINQKTQKEAYLVSKNYSWKNIFDSYLSLWGIC
jgi:glycosyltransferase involved in cell wall biosynthesis